MVGAGAPLGGHADVSATFDRKSDAEAYERRRPRRAVAIKRCAGRASGATGGANVRCGHTDAAIERCRYTGNFFSTHEPFLMPKTTLVFAVLLIALGVVAFGISSNRTALLPAYLGAALAVLGGLSLAFAGARKHLMHVATVVALLGALAPAAVLLIRAAQMSPLALWVNIGMLALSGGLLVLMLRSFIAARRRA